MEGKVIYKGKTRSGNDFAIRYPMPEDAQKLLDYINNLSRERTFIRFQGEQINYEDESKYLNEQIKRINLKKTIELFVVCEGNIIGVSNIDLKDKIESHEGVIGISVSQDFRGEGIGRLLMQLMLKEAEENLSDLKVITLGVFENNQVAYNMYKSFGFMEYGRLPEGIFYKGEYIDHIYMYKKIK